MTMSTIMTVWVKPKSSIFNLILTPNIINNTYTNGWSTYITYYFK